MTATHNHWPMTNRKRQPMARRIRPFVAQLAPTLLVCSCFTESAPSRAEPVTNRVLSGYQLDTVRGCVLFKFNFNFRIRYVSHFPLKSGTELRIMLRPIDPQRFDLESVTPREALRPPRDRATGVKSILYQGAVAEGPTLSIVFDRMVNFDVGGGAEFQSLVVAIGDPRGGKACRAEFAGAVATGRAAAEAEAETVVSRRQVPRETVVTKQQTKPIPIPECPRRRSRALQPAPAKAKPVPCRNTPPRSSPKLASRSGRAISSKQSFS
jgi:hypothetical protein